MVKNFEQFNENIQFDESKPEYYLRHYKDNETYTSIKHNSYEKTQYTGSEYRDLFMSWYDKIKPFLDNNNEYGAHKILVDWDEETLAKFDLYTLVAKYFKKF
jgi:hypothetical protein